MGEREKFEEIKGNCVDLITVGAADHCVDLEDDCRMSTCPRKHEEPIRREEAQCPVCGSIVAPHEIDLPKVMYINPWFVAVAFLAGMLLAHMLKL